MSSLQNKKSKFSLNIFRPPSPPTKVLTCDNTISILYVDQTNSNNYFSGNSGQYYSFGENLNGGSSGFNQGGGGHHNFYGRVDRLR